MKLIDVLVQELPRRGGWPEGVEDIWQDYDRLMRPLGWFHDELCDDHRRQHHDAHVKISRKQYEDALAASKEEWDGKSLPPAGLTCEVYFSNDDFPRWHSFIIKYLGERHVVAVVGGEEISYQKDNILGRDVKFRPKDKKREEVGLALYHAINWNAEGELVSPSRMEDYKKAYDAIAAGKIPHIRID